MPQSSPQWGYNEKMLINTSLTLNSNKVVVRFRDLDKFKFNLKGEEKSDTVCILSHPIMSHIISRFPIFSDDKIGQWVKGFLTINQFPINFSPNEFSFHWPARPTTIISLRIKNNNFPLLSFLLHLLAGILFKTKNFPTLTIRLPWNIVHRRKVGQMLNSFSLFIKIKIMYSCATNGYQ